MKSMHKLRKAHSPFLLKQPHDDNNDGEHYVDDHHMMMIIINALLRVSVLQIQCYGNSSKMALLVVFFRNYK